MARPHRPPSDHLSYLRRLATAIDRLEPLALLRNVEARGRGLPRIGTSRLPAQNLIDLAQTPNLAFPAATLDRLRVSDTRARLDGFWLGLTGPMAPLPLHLTEFASYERRYSRQQPFGGFLDVLAGRMLQLFYRAWATSSPAASVDRPGEDEFGDWIAALSGAEDGVRDDARLPPRARLHYAWAFASPRSPAALQDTLGHVVRMPVRIVEYMPRWREIEPDDRSRIGRGLATLGRDAIAGGRVRTVSDAFRVVVRVPDAAAFADMLPGGRRFDLLAEAIDALAPPHLEWDVELEVAGDAIKPTRLGGGARLGWTSFTGPAPKGGYRNDPRLGPSARRAARALSMEKRS